MALDAFNTGLLATQRSLHEAASGGQFCSSEAERRHMGAIDNGIRHMRLDSHFLDRSPLWLSQQPQQQLQRHQQSSMAALSSGQAFLDDYKSTMSREHAATLRQSQTAANHAVALDGLRQLRRQFDPPAAESHDRVQRFCDWVGVTDRFTGYRNNLTRGSRQPLDFAPGWRRENQGLPALQHPKFVPETLSTTPANRFNLRQSSAPACRQSSRSASFAAPTFAEKTPQEAAGIPTKFPGSTEYKDRYLRPKTCRATFDYKINPQPDFTVLGRPLMRAEASKRTTEYEERYIWPDAKNLQPTPWNKS